MEFIALKEKLEKHSLRSELIRHPFFDYLEKADVSRELAAHFVGQWWHPLHYFPTFLSRMISSTGTLAVKTATSQILFQELGEGNVARAHESIYITSMQQAGFTLEQITQAKALPSTAALVSGYEASSYNELTGIGFMYATEVADLAMVSAIGTAVRRAVGPIKLEWVDIHIQQEPGHVSDASGTIALDYSEFEVAEIIGTAETAWKLWIGFFNALYALADQEARVA